MPVATGRPGRFAAGAFVGREHELALLERSLADARAGRGRLVVLTGDRGSGKSRLADELASRAKGVGARVLWGGCWEAGGAPAYWPWLQALRAYVRETEPPAGELPPLLAEAGEGTDSEEARFRLFDATTAFIRRAAADQPLLLVLDDLHAADPASLLLLEFAVVELADAPVLLVAAYREAGIVAGSPQADALAAATRRASLRLPLHGLSEEAVGTYLALTAPFDAPAELVAAITAETGGNPLRLGEVVRSLEMRRTAGRNDRPRQRPL
jgi:predicted ATPase